MSLNPAGQLSEWIRMSLSIIDFDVTLEHGALGIVGRRSHVELLLGQGEAVAKEASLTVGWRFEFDGMFRVDDVAKSHGRRGHDEQSGHQHVCSPTTHFSSSQLITPDTYQHFLFRRRSLTLSPEQSLIDKKKFPSILEGEIRFAIHGFITLLVICIPAGA